MKPSLKIKLTSGLAIVLVLSVATANAQTKQRIFKASPMDQLDPSLIESELIESTKEEFNKLPVFKKASGPMTTPTMGSSEMDELQEPTKLPSALKGNAEPEITNPEITNPEIKNLSLPFENTGLNNGKSSQGRILNEAQNKLSPITFPNSKNGNIYETKSTPTIQTQITAPKSTIVNQPARFFIQAINVGRTNVNSVKLIATLPSHAKFVNSDPQPSNVNGQQYEFVLNGLSARVKKTIQIDVTPTEKLPLNIGTQIQIASDQQFAVSVQQPVLEVFVESPQIIQTGKTLTHKVKVTNVGDGIAESVRITADRPSQLEVGKEQQKTLVPTLMPGQSTHFSLTSFATAEGDAAITFQVSANGAESRNKKTPIKIIRPELGVQLLGPSQNYLGRSGIYTIKLQNTSEIAITGINVQLQMPQGLLVDTISQSAKINNGKGSLTWGFENIPGNQQQVIQFKAKSTMIGKQICRINVNTQETGSREMALATEVLGRADLSIRVSDSGSPVGVGSKSEFQIEVSNHGSQRADEVAVQVELPSGLMPVNQPGYSVDPAGNTITFNEIAVEAGKRQTFKFVVVAVAKGEHIVRGTVSATGSNQKIISENSIFVFETENSKVSEALVPEIRR